MVKPEVKTTRNMTHVIANAKVIDTPNDLMAIPSDYQSSSPLDIAYADGAPETTVIRQLPTRPVTTTTRRRHYPRMDILGDETQTVYVGHDVTWECRPRKRGRKVKWYRKGHQPLPANASQSSGRLSLINVKPDDAGQYWCLTLDGSGMRSVTLKVIPVPLQQWSRYTPEKSDYYSRLYRKL